jgi:5'-deoxynucleotidase
MSHLFAYLFRMKFIRRWGLMHTTYPENVQEHSQRVALIAHALAMIRNELFGGDVDADRIAALALYHDASEALTGDLPAPVKYFNPEIQRAYKGIETTALAKLAEMVPEELADAYRPLLQGQREDPEAAALIKAADKLCAYIKCLEELRAGNREFVDAARTLRSAVEQVDLPEVEWFLRHFVPSFELTLDELGSPGVEP